MTASCSTRRSADVAKNGYLRVEPRASIATWRTTAIGVRRDKAALSSGCKAHPAISLQPEAIGAVMEVTKWLKPSNSGHDLVTARVCRPQSYKSRVGPLHRLHPVATELPRPPLALADPGLIR